MSDAPPHNRRSVYAERLAEFAEFAFGDEQTFQRRGRWRDFFQERIGPGFSGRLVFEIGCADAALVARVAAKYPHIGFIGLDWKAKAVYDGARRVAERGLRNVVLLRGRAQHTGRIFGAGEVDEVWVFHPEPCDREAELQNRLITPSFMCEVSHVLRDRRSILALKTDHADYHQWVLANASGSNGLEVVMNSADYWNDAAALAHTSERAFAGEVTTYEARFLKKRRPIYYLELQKVMASPGPARRACPRRPGCS